MKAYSKRTGKFLGVVTYMGKDFYEVSPAPGIKHNYWVWEVAIRIA